MNRSKGKIEALLLGTTNKVGIGSSDFRPNVNDKEIIRASSYKRLGVDGTLKMNTFLDKCFKKSSSRLSLLAKRQADLDMTAAKAMY